MVVTIDATSSSRTFWVFHCEKCATVLLAPMPDPDCGDDSAYCEVCDEWRFPPSLRPY